MPTELWMIVVILILVVNRYGLDLQLRPHIRSTRERKRRRQRRD